MTNSFFPNKIPLYIVIAAFVKAIFAST